MQDSVMNLNRDKNGNGVIDYLPNDPDNNELEWYLPSTYQALGILASAGTIIYDAPNALASNLILPVLPAVDRTGRLDFRQHK